MHFKTKVYWRVFCPVESYFLQWWVNSIEQRFHISHVQFMSYHVMSFNVFSCHVMLCHLMSLHVMLRLTLTEQRFHISHIMLSFNVIWCYVMSCHVLTCHVISNLDWGEIPHKPCPVHVISCYDMSFYPMSYHVMSCHFMPFHVMLCLTLTEQRFHVSHVQLSDRFAINGQNLITLNNSCQENETSY